ncbi:MAG TPA: HEAT repeat domain-containing protein [Sandaracinaceae bacterium LLY-WYZ-13_1]|nr:HEAT repeat domain-containing protein [Sandaracinaceae bacterium LLY-WYZ-13_1]
MALDDTLNAIFDADRAARDAEDDLLGEDPGAVADLLAGAVQDALRQADPAESELRLRRLADLCAQVPGPKVADALLAILDHPEPAIRTEAGEALLDVAFERFKEVARAVERALDRGHEGPSMQELPFVLTEVRDPDPVPLVARFLAHPQPEVVAAAIEALAAYGDPAAARHLEPLLDDAREATLDDLDEAPTRIGELAEAALEELGIEA